MAQNETEPLITKTVNSCILPDLVPLLELGPNPHVYPLTAKHIRVAATTPEYLQFGMVCMILSHRLNRTMADGRPNKALAERFYHYWGLAVRSLNEHLDVEDARTGDLAIAGILTLLLADVGPQRSSIPGQRRRRLTISHIAGAERDLARLALPHGGRPQDHLAARRPPCGGWFEEPGAAAARALVVRRFCSPLSWYLLAEEGTLTLITPCTALP